MARSMLVSRTVMSPALLALVCTLSLAAGPEVRAVPEERNTTYGPNLLFVNPGDLFSGALTVEYERAVNPWFGVAGGLSVWSFRGVFIPDGQPSYTAISPELSARFHFVRNAPGGFWLGPTASFGYLLESSTGVLTRPWSWGLSVTAGYNFIIGHHFTVQIGGGGGFIDYGERLVWSPRVRFGLGIAF